MAAVVGSLISLKGGVGKTTTTVNIGAAAADTYKLRVLLLDADPQGHLSDWLGVKRRPGLGLAELLNPTTASRPTLEACLVQPDDTVPLWIVPTSYEAMEQVETLLSSDPTLGGIWSLHRIIQPALDNFDLILFDTRPTLGNLTSASICASHAVFPTTEPRLPSFQSTLAAVAKAEMIRDRQNPSLSVPGWILNRWDNHEEGRTVLEQMKKREIAAFQPAIGVSEYIPKAYLYGAPAVWQYPNHRGPHRDYIPLTGNILTTLGLVVA